MLEGNKSIEVVADTAEVKGKMNLLIFGATGSIGRQLVKQAIAQGHTVTAFARTDKTTQLIISRADVADFMLKQLTDNTYLYKTPGVSY
jgi:putative NADH-flavin reductase